MIIQVLLTILKRLVQQMVTRTMRFVWIVEHILKKEELLKHKDMFGMMILRKKQKLLALQTVRKFTHVGTVTKKKLKLSQQQDILTANLTQQRKLLVSRMVKKNLFVPNAVM